MAVAVKNIISISFVNMSPEANNLTFFNISASSANISMTSSEGHQQHSANHFYQQLLKYNGKICHKARVSDRRANGQNYA